MDSNSAPKRKAPPTNGGGGKGRHVKKQKAGSAGRWQTPHYKAKLAAKKAKGRTLELGDVGFWVTCQRGKEGVALEEAVLLCEEFGEKLHGIKPESQADDEGSDEEEAEEADIASSIQKEVDSMKTAAQAPRRADAVFDPVRLSLDCLIFVRTRAPVEPCGFVRAICLDALSVPRESSERRSRFINRLTPISYMGKATESGVEEVARKVLPGHFQMVGEEGEGEGEGGMKDGEGEGRDRSYAIRLSFRAHNTLKRDGVIKQVASLIGPRHKVDLTHPGKVILIEIYQTFCGMSVVDGDWDALKRYNLYELCAAAPQAKGVGEDAAKDSDVKAPAAKEGEAKAETEAEQPGVKTAAEEPVKAEEGSNGAQE